MLRNIREENETWEHYRNKYGWRAARLEHRREYNKINRKARKEQGYKEQRIFTNLEKTEGFQNHHVTKTFTIAIPSFIHCFVPHSLRKYSYGEGMEEINAIALNYLLSGI